MVNRENDLAYCAGFFDGEGSIIVCEKKTKAGLVYHVAQASIQQNDPDVLAFFRDCVGVGSISAYVSPRGNRIWRWQASTQGAGYAMKLLLPYLRLKHAEAQLAIEFMSHSNGAKTHASAEQLLSRRNLFHKYREIANARKAVSYG